jgi:hypothetical protein
MMQKILQVATHILDVIGSPHPTRARSGTCRNRFDWLPVCVTGPGWGYAKRPPSRTEFIRMNQASHVSQAELIQGQQLRHKFGFFFLSYLLINKPISALWSNIFMNKIRPHLLYKFLRKIKFYFVSPSSHNQSNTDSIQFVPMKKHNQITGGCTCSVVSGCAYTTYMRLMVLI